VSLEIVDDGHGLGPGSGFGLVGIRERVEGLGGSLTIESSPGAGVCVRVDVPG
jgi:signal transduction histidine kinase